jgi:thioredoxin-dependent peroxiredoxin
MKSSVSVALAAFVLAGLSVVTARAADDAAMPAEGQKAPGFTLPSQEGSPISLDQYRGKWVVLYFYPKDMTTGCTIEAHKFQDALPQLEAKNAVVLGVSVDTIDSHKQFCAKDGLTFHLLADPDHKVVSEYGSLGAFNGIVIANRNTFLIDPKGTIRKVYLNVSPKVNEHSKEVLAQLDELQKKSD